MCIEPVKLHRYRRLCERRAVTNVSSLLRLLKHHARGPPQHFAIVLVHVIDLLDEQLLQEHVLLLEAFVLLLQLLGAVLHLTRRLHQLLLTLFFLLAEASGGGLVAFALIFVCLDDDGVGRELRIGTSG